MRLLIITLVVTIFGNGLSASQKNLPIDKLRIACTATDNFDTEKGVLVVLDQVSFSYKDKNTGVGKFFSGTDFLHNDESPKLRFMLSIYEAKLWEDRSHESIQKVIDTHMTIEESGGVGELYKNETRIIFSQVISVSNRIAFGVMTNTLDSGMFKNTKTGDFKQLKCLELYTVPFKYTPSGENDG